jgi:hypothetical protein
LLKREQRRGDSGKQGDVLARLSFCRKGDAAVEYLFGLLIILLLTPIGHGIWVGLAKLFRLLSGNRDDYSSGRMYGQACSFCGEAMQPFEHRCPRCGLEHAAAREAADLRVTARHLREFLDEGLLDRKRFQLLRNRIEARHRTLTGQSFEPASHSTPEKAAVGFLQPVVSQSVMPRPEPEELLEVLPAVETPVLASAVQKTPRKTVQVPAPVEPRAPRRTLTEWLAAFMEERNILWGELVGGLLMVGCSIALVISLWQHLETIEYSPFLVVAALTGALFGAGHYTLHRWKLPSTSRGLLVIATLMVPLNIMVLAGLSKGTSGGWLEIATKAAAVAGFAWLVHRAGRVLLPVDDSERPPRRRWASLLLPLAVVATPISQLSVVRFLGSGEVGGWFVALAAWPVAWHALSVGGFLGQRLASREPQRPEENCGRLLGFLGLAGFALLLSLSFIGFWSVVKGGCSRQEVLEQLAVSVALAGVPALLTGLFVRHNKASAEPGSKDSQLLMAGTGVALVGMLVMLASLLLAWPNPVVLLLVCLVDFVVLTTVAFLFRLPLAHAPALVCLSVGYLTAYHLGAGHFAQLPREEWSGTLMSLAIAVPNATALVMLFAIAVGAAEALTWKNRAADAGFYRVWCCAIAFLSLGMAGQAAFIKPESARAAVLFGLFASSAWLLSWRWKWKWLDHAGAVLILGAILWALHWRRPGEYALWGFVLAAEALLFSILVRGWWPQVLLAAGLGLFAFVAPPAESGWHTLSLFSLAAAALVQAGRRQLPQLTWIGSGVLLLGIAHGLLLRLENLELPVPLLLTLLIHATVTLAAGFLIRLRRPQDVATFAVPLGQSVLFPLLLAIPVLFVGMERDQLIARAVYAGWLAALWLAQTMIERRPRFFPVFQGVLAVAVLFGVAESLARQPWVEENYPLGLLDPRSLQTFGIALTGLSILWGLSSLLLGARPAARAFLDAVTPSVDRVILGAVVIGQAALAIWGLAPGLLLEMAPRQAKLAIPEWSASAQDVFGIRGWVLLATLALTLAFWLWEARTALRLTAVVLGLVVLALTVPVLAAGPFSEDLAAASALRWGLAGCFLAASLPLWLRSSLARYTARWDSHAGSPHTAPLARGVLLGVAALPVVGLSIWMAVVVFMGLTPGGPVAGSFFIRAGEFTSHLLPLSIVLAGLTGHALREWSEEDAFAGGLVTLLIVMGGYALSVIEAGGALAWDNWIILLQAGTIAAALWALGWMDIVTRLPRGFFGASPRRVSLLPSGTLLRVHVLLAVLGNLILALLALPRLLANPTDLQMLADLLAVGNIAGWLTFAAGLFAILTYARRFRRAWEPHVWGGAILGFGVLVACVAARWDQQNWLAYHALMTVWTLSAWVIAFSGRWSTQAATRWQNQHTMWVRILGGLVVALALRTAWHDPARPYFSSTAILAVALLAGILALRRRQLLDVILTGVLLELAGVLAWIDLGPDTVMSLLCVNVLCAALASIAWTVVLRIRLAAEQSGESITPTPLVLDFTKPFRHSVAFGSAVALAVLALLGFFSMAASVPTPINNTLGWCAWSAVALAVGLCLWDAGARFPLPALYGLGLTAIVILLQGGEGTLSLLARASMLLLAGYVLLTSIVARVGYTSERWLQSLRLPWPLASSQKWFVPAQVSVSGLVVLLSLGVTLVLGTMGERFTGPLALSMLLPAGALLAGLTVASDRRTVRDATLLLGVLFIAELGWAVFDPNLAAITLHRSVAVLFALAAGTVIYGFGLPRLLPKNPWGTEGRRIATVLGIAASVMVTLVLLLEGLAFDLSVYRTPLVWLEITTVVAALAGLATAGIAFAVVPRADPLALSERRRPYYVYVSELMLVFLFLHLRLRVPELFQLFNREYWTFLVMFVAFVGVGLSEFFHRRRLHVLATPLQRTGIFLPLLPLLAFWLNPPEALRAAILRVLPGVESLLQPFRGIPGFDLNRYAVLWFLLGMLYAGLAVTRRSFRFALFASLAANAGLWVLLYGYGPSLLVHPQLWLIPLALIVLVSEAVNRSHLSREFSTGLRYIGLGMLYLSSTADFFIAGLGESVSLPIILAALSILGALAGILFRLRSYLYLGVAFLVLDIVSMIWHAAVNLRHPWVWWVSGIVLGAAILALFALFEKRRQHMLHLVEDFRSWR